MILYNIKCRKDHVFETWFRDSAAYDEQVEAGAISCPTCGSRKVEKALMAPRLARSGRSRDARAVKEIAEAAEVMGQLRELRQKVEESCDYVGGNFAEEARKIHYGEQDPRSIYGETSDKQAKELHDEGVTFSRIPWAPRRDS